MRIKSNIAMPTLAVHNYFGLLSDPEPQERDEE
jgi:hypothetical protein